MGSYDDLLRKYVPPCSCIPHSLDWSSSLGLGITLSIIAVAGYYLSGTYLLITIRHLRPLQGYHSLHAGYTRAY